MNVFQYTLFICSAIYAVYTVGKPILFPETMHFWSAVTERLVLYTKLKTGTRNSWIRFDCVHAFKFNNDFWTSIERITAAVKNAGSHSEFLPSEVLISWCQPNGSWPLVMRLSRNTILYQQFLFYLLNNRWIRHWLVLVAQTCKWYLLLLVQF